MTHVIEAGDGGLKLSSTTRVVEAADARLWLARLEIGIHFQKRIAGLDDDGVGVNGPLEVVEDGGEGIGDGDVVVDEEAVLVAATFGDTPAHDLRWAGEDLGFTGRVLTVGFLAWDAIAEAAGVDDGEKAIA